MSPRSPRVAALLQRQRHLDAAVARARALRPRSLSHRSIGLLRALDLFTPELLQPRPGPHDPTYHRLAAVEWRHPLWSWRGPDYRSLLDHLLVSVDHPLPPWLFLPYERGSPALPLLAHLGAGGSPREARRLGLLPWCMTRRMDHLLVTEPRALPLLELVRRIQVRGLGGPPWLEDAVVNSRLGALALEQSPAWWQGVIGWLCRHHRALPPDRVGPLVDWMSSCGFRADPALLRRGPARMLANCRQWHERPRAPAYRRGDWSGELRRSGIPGGELRQASGCWTVQEITLARALLDEGRELRHCVASYRRLIQAGRSAIFSLRWEGARRITVEVRPATRQVVQARGLCNRQPDAEERAVLERWASEAGLTVSSF